MLKRKIDSTESGFVLSGRNGAEKKIQKKYVRIDEAVQLYSIGHTKLREIAREAKAIRVIGRVTLYDVDKLNEYIDSFEI